MDGRDAWTSLRTKPVYYTMPHPLLLIPSSESINYYGLSGSTCGHARLAARVEASTHSVWLGTVFPYQWETVCATMEISLGCRSPSGIQICSFLASDGGRNDFVLSFSGGQHRWDRKAELKWVSKGHEILWAAEQRSPSSVDASVPLLGREPSATRRHIATHHLSRSPKHKLCATLISNDLNGPFGSIPTGETL